MLEILNRDKIWGQFALASLLTPNSGDSSPTSRLRRVDFRVEFRVSRKV